MHIDPTENATDTDPYGPTDGKYEKPCVLNDAEIEALAEEYIAKNGGFGKVLWNDDGHLGMHSGFIAGYKAAQAAFLNGESR